MDEEDFRTEIALIKIGVAILILAVPLFFLSGILVLGGPGPDFRPYLLLMIIGSVIIIISLLQFALEYYPKRKKSAIEKYKATTSITLLTLMIIFVVVVLNPFISPCPWVYDTDGDGYADAFDAYPHYPNAWSAWPPLPVCYLFNKSLDASYWNLTAYSQAIDPMWLLDSPQSEKHVLVEKADNSVIFVSIVNMSRSWNNGILFNDIDSNQRFGVGDGFLLDKTLYPAGTEFFLTDEWGEMFFAYSEL